MRLLAAVLLAVSVLGCATTAAATPSGAPSATGPAVNAPALNPYGKYFEGNGLVVEMAMLAETNVDGLHDVLLRFRGAEAFNEGLDGKVLRYTARHGGTGVDFVTQVGGQDYVRMLSRQSWGSWTFFEVYLDKKEIKVGLDEAKSKTVDVKALAADLGK